MREPDTHAIAAIFSYLEWMMKSVKALEIEVNEDLGENRCHVLEETI
jgi:hypothetical protein